MFSDDEQGHWAIWALLERTGGSRYLDLQFLIPDAQGLYRDDRDGVPVLHLRTTDGSWAEATTGAAGHRVTEGGPRRIWELAEQAADLWTQHDRPTRSRFGLTATTAGTQHLWLDDPTCELPTKTLACVSPANAQESSDAE